MDKITKYITVKAEKKDDRVLRFIGSDEKVDSQGDLIKLEGWDLKQYKKNPVVLFAHNYTGKPVARAKKVFIDKEKKALVFDIEFAPAEVSSEADSLYKLYASGFMKAVSVGFAADYNKVTYPEKKSDKGPSRIFNGQTLHELSLVAVGANSRALLVSKSMDEAVEAEVVDQLEINELLSYFKEDEAIEKPIEPPTDDNTDEAIPNYKAKLDEAETKIAELELSLAEQKMNDEITENDIYTELYKEFSLAFSDQESISDNEEQTEKIINSVINTLKKEE